MLQHLEEMEEALAYAKPFVTSKAYSTPFLMDEELVERKLKNIIKRDDCFGIVSRKEDINGVFGFLADEDERYLELLLGYSDEASAWEDLLEYLDERHNEYEVDFVVNPMHDVAKSVLKKAGARFETPQMSMELKRYKKMDSIHCAEYSDEYKEGYSKIHTVEGYWSADKVVDNLDKFEVYLALEDDAVVGYIDVSDGFVFDLYVVESKRSKGYGRELLSLAIANSKKHKMQLTVDIDNDAAIHLYEKLGFEEIVGNRSQTIIYQARRK